MNSLLLLFFVGIKGKVQVRKLRNALLCVPRQNSDWKRSTRKSSTNSSRRYYCFNVMSILLLSIVPTALVCGYSSLYFPIQPGLQIIPTSAYIYIQVLLTFICFQNTLEKYEIWYFETFRIMPLFFWTFILWCLSSKLSELTWFIISPIRIWETRKLFKPPLSRSFLPLLFSFPHYISHCHSFTKLIRSLPLF